MSTSNAAKVREKTGIDINGYERVLQSSDIRHVMNSHGDPLREATRRQIAIRKADCERISEIVENAHSVVAAGARAARKRLRLTYTAYVEGFEYEYAEMVPIG